MKLYENVFEVTETLQNGKERRVKKSVYTPRFKERDGHTFHISEEERIKCGTYELEARHYYNVKYLYTKKREVIYTEL